MFSKLSVFALSSTKLCSAKAEFAGSSCYTDDGVGKIVEFVAGYVHREPAVRSAEGRLLGHPRHGRHSVHLLLHRQDPGGVPVRGGCGDR